MVVDLQELARRMLADYDARTPGRLFGEPTELSSDDAYAVQAEITRLREERGEKVVGYKVGCISKPIQAQLGVKEPIFGRLFDSECHPSGVQLSAARYANLAVEGELAVRLGKDLLGPEVSEEDCRGAIEAIFPVIELHHYVLPKPCPPGQWMIASNGLHAGLVLPTVEARCPGIAPSLRVRIDSVTVGFVQNGASLARPVTSLKWLARRLTPFGLRLRQSQLILTGSTMPLYPVASGSRIVVEAPSLGASCVEIGP